MTAHHPFYERLHNERERRGWSQSDLAEKVGCDTKTVGRWERGKSLPQSRQRQALIEIFGKSIEELGLTQEVVALPLPLSTSVDQLPLAERDASKHTPSSFPREDWGEAPDVTNLYGRDEECATLEQWMSEPGCHIGVILGMGGAGKTTIASAVATRAKQNYERLFWRSLLHAPPFEHLLKQCLEFLSQQNYSDLPKDVGEQISLLLTYLRQQRCLLVLDNFETLLQTGRGAGHYREEYAAYGRLLRRVGETQHQSFLLVTSREKPKEIAHLEGKRSPVRSFSLAGLGLEAGQQLLNEKDLSGSKQDWLTLIERYTGNPLALQLVAESIQGVFAGDIARFLAQETFAFGDISDLLAQHFQRLSEQEQELMDWLAIEREPVSMEDLSKDLAYPALPGTLLDALDSLRRRSLIELRGAGRFSLQPVIMEYTTNTLIERANAEFETDTPEIWSRYALMKAHAREYVRESQERLLLAPIAQHLSLRLGLESIERKVKDLLNRQRQDDLPQSGYLPGNMLNLLNHLHCDLRGFDFSHLVIRQAYLQGALLPEVNFAYTRFAESLFTSTFGSVLAVVCSPQGDVFAAGTTSGEVRIYDAVSYALRLTCQGHTDGVWSLAFSPDGTVLASSSDDHTIHLWDSRSGSRLKTLLGHTSRVRALAFHPDGTTLASGSDDHMICLWNIHTGNCIQELAGHIGRVWSVAFHRHGRLLASGSTDRTVRIWDLDTSSCLLTLPDHSNSIRSVIFHPQDELLVSGSDDQTVRMWDISSSQCLRTLAGHTNRVWSLAFNSRGDVLASASEDQTIRLWKSVTGESLQVLSGHSQGVRSLAFLPGQPVLVSGGEDQTIRTWDISTGNCLQTVQGYTMRIWSLAFSPDGGVLTTCSEDSALRIWESATGQCRKVLPDRRHRALAVAFAPDNLRIASGGQDQMVHIWDRHSGRCLARLEGHTNWVRTVNFSPDGRYLASGGEDQTLRVWDTQTASCIHELLDHTNWVRSVVFSPDGQTLASCGDDQTIRLWDFRAGRCLCTLQGHTSRVRTIAFSPDGQTMASGSEDQSILLWHLASEKSFACLQGYPSWIRSVAFSPDGQMLAGGGEDGIIHLWDVPTWQCLQTFRGHASRVRQVSFNPDGQSLATCGDDGTVKLWDKATMTCLKTLISGRPYEGMNITGVQGLTAALKTSLEILGAMSRKP